jgi:hypothetical protein
VILKLDAEPHPSKSLTKHVYVPVERPVPSPPNVVLVPETRFATFQTPDPAGFLPPGPVI